MLHAVLMGKSCFRCSTFIYAMNYVL
jgi:hypothetical protein